MPALDLLDDEPFWHGPLSPLLARLGSAPDGLTSGAAARRLARVGPNLLQLRREDTLGRLVWSRFRNPLIILLVVASAIAAVAGDVGSFITIVAVVLLSVTLDSAQEYRAGRAAERLRESVATRVRVLRDGAPHRIAARRLVPGDVVLLAAGDLVPADGRLLPEGGRSCFVNQALLSGEPYPVEKRPRPEGEPQADLADAVGAACMGTSVVSGGARLLVCRTGRRTALGTIGAGLERRPPPTAFEQGTRGFGLLVLRLAVLLVLGVLLVNSLRHRPPLESFLFAVALAVGLAPELLPMIVSVTLARGALRLAAQRVIVKRLAAIHDLGTMDVLCTDKTGTLTEGRVRLERHLDPLGRDSSRVLELAYVNSVFQAGLRSPLDDAILRHKEVDVRGWEKLDEIPFDFERRRVSVLAAHGGAGAPLLLVKGALEDVVALSTRYEVDGPGKLAPLDERARADALARFDALGREGFRVLGLAWKSRPRNADAHGLSAAEEADLVFAGFAAFEDPPKPTAAAALRALAARGVTVKILTGDNETVTRHLCGEIGLPVARVLGGDEVRRLSDSALEALVERTTAFCRVTPPEKTRIIQALQRRGHAVGCLGDGINDAPSLHAADVGISVDSGVDVAKEAADLILLAPDLGVLAGGVVEGRRTSGNILKYIMMATSSNFGNMFSMAAASLVLPFLPMLPTQVLLNNLLYDVSEVPIPMDTVDEAYTERPHRWDAGLIRNFMLVMGPVSSLFDFATFYVMLRVFGAGAALFHTGWFVESLATQILVIFVIRTRGSPLRSRPSALLTLTSLAVVALTVLLPFTPLGGSLGFVPLPAPFFLMLAGLVVAYLAGAELVKRLFYVYFTR